MDPLVIAIAGLGFVGAIAVVAWVYSLMAAPRNEVVERIERVTRTQLSGVFQMPQAPAQEEKAAGGNPLTGLLRVLSKASKPKEGEDLGKVKKQLIHAGIRNERAVEVFFGAKLGLGVLLVALFFVASALRTEPIGHTEVWVILLAAIGFYFPNMWLSGQVKTRQTALSKSLPDTLDLIVTCVEAGLGLDAALTRITGDMGLSAPELTAELQQTAIEMHTGVARPEAFRRLAERTGLEELRSLSAMLIQSEMFGTSIAKALRQHSSTLRVRRTHRAEEQGAMVSVKLLIPLILCILPSLFCVILGPAVVRIQQALLPALAAH